MWVWGVYYFNTSLPASGPGFEWLCLSRFLLKMQVSAHLPAAQNAAWLPPHSEHQRPLPPPPAHTVSHSLAPIPPLASSPPSPAHSAQPHCLLAGPDTVDTCRPQRPRSCCSFFLGFSSTSPLSLLEGSAQMSSSLNLLLTMHLPSWGSPQPLPRLEDQGSERVSNLPEVPQQQLWGSSSSFLFPRVALTSSASAPPLRCHGNPATHRKGTERGRGGRAPRLHQP